MNSVLIFTSNIFHPLSHTHSTHTELSKLFSTHRVPSSDPHTERRSSKLRAPNPDPHTELHHLPHAKRSSPSPSRSRSSPRTVSFPFPFLSLICSFLWPITLISPIHHLIISFLTPIHSLSSFLSPIHTALIHTPKILVLIQPTHPQTHKQPNLHPSLISFWNPTFHRRQPNPVPFSPYFVSLLLLLLLLLLYTFFLGYDWNFPIFIWLIMSIGCS